MIFGKTLGQKYKEEQARLELLLGRQPYYAWLPTKLNDGNWAWFEHIYKDHGYYKNQCGHISYFTSAIGTKHKPTYYKESE